MNILDEVKTRLSITGTDLDGTIQGMIDDVISYCRSAGLKYTQLMSTRAVGLIARGVADLWNYGAGNGKFSDIFQLRLNQMTLDAASLDHDVESQEKSVTITENGTTTVTPDDGYVLSSVNVDVNVPSKPEQAKSVTITENGTTTVTPDDGYVLSSVNVDVNVPSKPEQAKSVTITENGTTTVTPDDGYVLSSVNVDVNVPSKPEQVKSVTITENGTTQITPDEGYALSSVSVSVEVAGGASIVTIPPVSWPSSRSSNILDLTTDIDLGNVTWANDKINNISGLFRNMPNLKSVKWGDLSSHLADSVGASYLFYWCYDIESIDFTQLNTIISDPNSMFNDCKKLKNIVWGNTKINASSFGNMFYGCSILESLDTSFLDPKYSGTTSIASMFYNCRALKALDLSNLKTVNITSAPETFKNCAALANLVFEEGCFSKSGLTSLDLSYSPLTHDCAVDIFNKLATRTNSPTLKLSTTTKGYLTEQEYAIATAKGWVVS